jgi:hypothetical protein
MSYTKHVSDYYRNVTTAARNSIMALPEDQLSDKGQVVKKLVAEYALEPIIILNKDEKPEVVQTTDIRIIPAHEREEGHQSEGDLNYEFTKVIGTFRLASNNYSVELSQMAPVTRSMSWTVDECIWSEDSIKFIFDIKGYGFDSSDPDKVLKSVRWQADRITEHIAWLNIDIEAGNNQLELEIGKMVDQRLAQIAENKKRSSEIEEALKTGL